MTESRFTFRTGVNQSFEQFFAPEVDEYDPEMPEMKSASMYSPTVSPKNRPYSPTNPSLNDDAHYQYRGYQGQPKGTIERRKKNFKRKHIPPSNLNDRLKIVQPSHSKKKPKKYRKLGPPLIQPKLADLKQRTLSYNGPYTRVIPWDERQYYVLNTFRVPDNIIHKDGDIEYKGVCWWDMHHWNGRWVGCPYRLTETSIYTEGFFCSYNCAYAYAQNQKLIPIATHGAIEIKPLMHLLMRKDLMQQGKRLTVHALTLKKAPSFYITQMFGGQLSIDEFRNIHCTNKRYTCYPQRYAVIPTGMICYVENLDDPIKKFELSKYFTSKNRMESTIIGKKPQRTSRATMEPGATMTIPEFDKDTRKVSSRKKEKEEIIKDSAEVRHRKTRNSMQKTINNFKYAKQEKPLTIDTQQTTVMQQLSTPRGIEEKMQIEEIKETQKTTQVKKTRKRTKPPKDSNETQAKKPRKRKESTKKAKQSNLDTFMFVKR